MDEANWNALTSVAEKCGCVYNGKPSWRRMLTLIARGVLEVTIKDKHKLYVRRTHTKDTHELAEENRLRHEMKRRAAGIPPRGAQAALDEANGCNDIFERLAEPD